MDRGTEDWGSSQAFYSAACHLEEVKLELEAVSSTALLLATAANVDELVQDAFRGLANLIDATIAQVSSKSEEFMREHSESTGASSP